MGDDICSILIRHKGVHFYTGTNTMRHPGNKQLGILFTAGKVWLILALESFTAVSQGRESEMLDYCCYKTSSYNATLCKQIHEFIT